MKNLFWIIQSVFIVVIYITTIHFVFTFLSTWNSVAIVPIILFGGISFCIILPITLVAYIVSNYKHFECTLFD